MPTRYTTARTRRQRRYGRNYVARTRRRHYTLRKKRRYYKPYSLSTYRGRKMLDARRKNVGLPPVETKRSLKYQDKQQYTAFSSSVWSHTEDFGVIAEGTDNETRESNKLYMLPTKKFQVRLEQPANTEFNYRLMIVKVFDKHTGPPTPDEILSNVSSPTGSWMYSNYDVFDDYTSTSPRFKVLKDVSFRWNTGSGAPSQTTLKKINFSLPGANIEYDEDQTDGTFNKNTLHLCVLTDATATSSSHTITYQSYMRFLDR